MDQTSRNSRQQSDWLVRSMRPYLIISTSGFPNMEIASEALSARLPNLKPARFAKQTNADLQTCAIAAQQGRVCEHIIAHATLTCSMMAPIT